MLGRSGAPSGHADAIRSRLAQLDLASLRRRAADAERELYNLGITFTVYSNRTAIDRILPFDVIPRILSRDDWTVIESGVKQRVAALNLFLTDVYGAQKILKDGVVPADLVRSHSQYHAAMEGIRPSHGTFVHVCGSDIVRDADGQLYVLEDNARTPSGVSYVLENRYTTLRAFPDLLGDTAIRRVSDYGIKLAEAMAEIAPPGVVEPQVVLLSPGVYNSAYFEHVFLAREMGVPLVEPRDLVVDDDTVYMKTTAGLERVDVVFRRISDEFIDPEVFRPDSLLGVPGLMRAYARGRVSLANAVGNGVADDKATYAYMPRIIRYYLGEDAILPNVETYLCREPAGLSHTLANLDNLVVKPVGESGGYGIVIGPRATRAQLDAARDAIRADPSNFVSQPVISLSVCPTLVADGVAPRHVDLRPFAITGRDTWVLPGGLTRVALEQGSYVVNSSQGGGSKDTWVLE